MQYRSVTEKLRKRSSHCICKQSYLLGISLLSFGDIECGNIFKFFKWPVITVFNFFELHCFQWVIESGTFCIFLAGMYPTKFQTSFSRACATTAFSSATLFGSVCSFSFPLSPHCLAISDTVAELGKNACGMYTLWVSCTLWIEVLDHCCWDCCLLVVFWGGYVWLTFWFKFLIK